MAVERTDQTMRTRTHVAVATEDLLGSRSFAVLRRAQLVRVVVDGIWVAITIGALLWADVSGWLAEQARVYGTEFWPRAGQKAAVLAGGAAIAIWLALGAYATAVLASDIAVLTGRPRWRSEDLESGELVAVGAAETFCDVARRHYGSPAAWRTVMAANLGRRQVGGHVLFSFDQELEPGWMLWCPGAPPLHDRHSAEAAEHGEGTTVPAGASVSCPAHGSRREPVEVPGDHVTGYGGNADDHQGKGRGLAVGEVLLIRPELRRQSLDAGRDQKEGRGELGDRGEEDEAERRGDARSDEGKRHPAEDGVAPLTE